MVYKELQKTKFPTLRLRIRSTSHITTNTPISYAEAAKTDLKTEDQKSNALNDQEGTQNNIHSNFLLEVKDLLQNMMSQMMTITNMMAELMSKLVL